MAGNSLTSILEKMKQGSHTHGWGAISVFNRTRLNRILQQQWIEKYDGAGYMPPFSGRVILDELYKTEYADLEDIVFGSPRLSFESEKVSFDNSIATLTLSILSGTYTAYKKSGPVESVLYSYKITEAQGFTVTVDINLSMATGAVDHLGRVLLDLSRGTDMKCDLTGPRLSQIALGKYFQQRFNALPSQRRVFELGMLDFNGYSPLAPKKFAIRTQQAPGGNDARASTYGDGAVVVFIQLRPSEFGGDFPSETNFPYFIPDDKDAEGNDLYSAALILDKDFIPYASDYDLELMQSLLFPGDKDVFVETSRHAPHDLGIFGNIDQSRTAITLEPAFHSVKTGGKAFQYSVLRDGNPLSGVSWSIRSLNSHKPAGNIDAQGLCTPVSIEEIGQETVRSVVTASYVDPATGQKHRVSALLLVTSEPMTISPAVAPCLLQGTPQPITLVATALSGANLSWSTPQNGSLAVTGNTAIYTPPTTVLPNDQVIQPIVVRDELTGETVQSSLVLLRFAPDIEVLPGFVRSVKRSGTIQLEETQRSPELERRWRVLGSGTVTNSGLYTPPATVSNPFDIVVCDIIDSSERARYSGYSVIQLSKVTQEETWTHLKSFNVRKVEGSAYANGMQQMLVNIQIETLAVGTPPVTYELTGDEENSLTLSYKVGRENLKPIEKEQEGIEDGSPVVWAINWKKNRFDAKSGASAAQDHLGGGSVLKTDKDLYVHVRSDTALPDPTRFVATFEQGRTSAVFYSDLHPSENNTEDQGHVTLTPILKPRLTLSDYKFMATRVAGGGAGGEGRPPANPGDPSDPWPALPPGEDDFDYFLKTINYWRLDYVRGENLVPFLKYSFDDKCSLVKWESAYPNETMFSCTGYALHVFADADKDKPINRTISFDSALKNRRPLAVPVLKETFENDQATVSGQLLVTLSRTDDVRRDKSTDLLGLNDKSMVVKLLDIEGNRHSLDIAFEPDTRNKLVLKVL